MAVVVQTSSGFLVDNEEKLNKQYLSVQLPSNGDHTVDCTSYTFISLTRPTSPYFTVTLNLKRRRKSRKAESSRPATKEELVLLWKEIVSRKESLDYFKEMQASPTQTVEHTDKGLLLCDGLSKLCDLAKLAVPLYETTHGVDLTSHSWSDPDSGDLDVFNTVIVNPSDCALLCYMLGGPYLIPAHSQFLMSDITFLQPLVDTKPSSGYNLIVIDPPWNNGSVRRSKRYSSLQYSEMMKLPVDRLAASHALIIMWTTNHPKHVEFVKTTLFPYWSVEFKAEWHWMKVTTQGEPVIPMDSDHRKPYEPIIIGRFCQVTEDCSSNCAKKARIDKPLTAELHTTIPPHKVICSIPSCIHSKKPILSDVLSQYLPKDPKCLEMFARNLLPGWTSWGNEVLKFQNAKLYWKDTTTFVEGRT